MTTTAHAPLALAPLAIAGGQPVRAKPLPAAYLGTSVMGDEELALLTEVVRNKLPFREYGDGTPHMVKDFEREAAGYFGVAHALATATGSGSFYCAMAGLGVGPGDEVIIPAWGWHTDFLAPVLLGATPVFADIDGGFNLDPADFERKITPRTKAVVMIHYQGAAGDLARVLEIAKKHNLKVVEDVAQAAGGSYRGQKLGSWGDVACFSFQQNKILSTGDGGLFLAKDPLIFERAVRFHDLGFLRPSLAAQIGGQPLTQAFAGAQFRMNEFTGAVALAQLRKLDRAIVHPVQRLYQQLKRDVLADCPGIALRPTGDEEGNAGIAFYMDMGTADLAAWFNKALAAEGIRVGPSSGCTNLLHTDLVKSKRQAHPKLAPFGPGCPGEHVHYGPELCPNVDRVASRLTCVALCPAMSADDVRDVTAAIAKVWNQRPAEHRK
ncbi:MAG: aminotransferase class V-fold PLP-dependent enzyme [Planctomycetota bacterium]|nr:aminotransferase class V-fold PLP-dependent enzyme [Planctomycetota bacterium]